MVQKYKLGVRSMENSHPVPIIIGIISGSLSNHVLLFMRKILKQVQDDSNNIKYLNHLSPYF